jgi:hypothetical protein
VSDDLSRRDFVSTSSKIALGGIMVPDRLLKRQKQQSRVPLNIATVGAVAMRLVQKSLLAGGAAALLMATGITAQQPMNTLTEAERAAGWTLLFDGRSLDGWRGYNMPSLPGSWAAQDGTLARVGGGGDLITAAQYDDFELAFEWRVETGGNSGVFYRGVEGEQVIYHSAPEYQVLDDPNHADGRSPITSAGSNYALTPAPRGNVKPAGEWNSGRISVRGRQVEHWLNGTRVVAYELRSDEWAETVANSKFVEWPAYGMAERGHIGLQDHGDPVWYRNMKLRVLR